MNSLFDIIQHVISSVLHFSTPELTPEECAQLQRAESLQVFKVSESQEIRYVINGQPEENTQKTPSLFALVKGLYTDRSALKEIVFENAGKLSWDDLHQIAQLPHLEALEVKNTKIDDQIGHRGNLNKTHPHSFLPLPLKLKSLTINGCFKKKHSYPNFQEALGHSSLHSLEQFTFTNNEMTGIIWPLINWPKTLTHLTITHNRGGLHLLPSKCEHYRSIQEISSTLLSLCIEFPLRILPVYPEERRVGQIVYPIGKIEIEDEQDILFQEGHFLESLEVVWALQDGRVVTLCSQPSQESEGMLIEPDVLQSLPPYIIKNITTFSAHMKSGQSCSIKVLEEKGFD